MDENILIASAGMTITIISHITAYVCMSIAYKRPVGFNSLIVVARDATIISFMTSAIYFAV